MDEVEVEVVELEVFEGALAGVDEGCGRVVVVPDFGVDPEFGARDAVALEFGEDGADLLFVSVDFGAVEVAVSDGGGGADGFGHGVEGDVIGAEGAETEGGDGAVVERDAGDHFCRLGDDDEGAMGRWSDGAMG